MLARAVFLARAALAIAALAVLYDIGPPGITHPALGCLYAVVGGFMFYDDWRSGRLHKTIGQIYRNPPRSDALETLGFVLGTVALFTIL